MLQIPPTPESPTSVLVRRVDQAIDRLAEALNAGKSEELLAYLRLLGRFHRYSFSNVLLIAAQRPDATHVAGFQAWRKLGRWVRRGEKGIGILAPIVRRREREMDAECSEQENTGRTVRGFRAAHVFDRTQTEGAELPTAPSVSGDPGAALARLRDFTERRGIALGYGYVLGGAEGASSGGRITLRPGLTPAVEFSVLAHELAHELLHHGERRHETTATVRETEAEAVAFVVGAAVGLTTGTASSDYIQLYRGTPQTLAESLGFIQKTAAVILAALA